VKRIRVEEAAPGQRLARALYYPNGAAMLAAGAALSEAAIQRLVQFGYRDLYVQEEGAEDLDCRDLVAEPARAPMARKLAAFFKQLRDTVGRAAEIGSADAAPVVADKLGSPEVRRQVAALRFPESVGGPELDAFYDGIVAERDAPMVAAAPRTEATHFVDHSLVVAARSVLIARRIGWNPRELRELCVGAMLHDVGYHVLPEEILRAPAGQRLHPVAGYHLLRADTGLPLLAAHVAFQHHERPDGRGFPRKLAGAPSLAIRDSIGPGSIHRYASVVAVADRFDLLTRGFPDGWAIRDDEAIATIRAEAGSALHPEAVQAFLALTPVFPVGLEVQVVEGPHSGCWGVVASVSAAAPDRPAIRLVRRDSGPLPAPVTLDTAREAVKFRPKGLGDTR
jgi:HD-GYP domain-containing protein (c-di-GMP phosphodiesterase class II)